MKKIFILILLCFLSINVFSQNESSEKKQVSTECYVKSYGSAPFNYPVLVTADKTKYVVVCKDRDIKKLLNSQGIKIKVEGYVLEDTDEILNKDFNILYIKKWKKIK